MLSFQNHHASLTAQTSRAHWKAISQYLCCSLIQAFSPVCFPNPVLKAEKPTRKQLFWSYLCHSIQVISQTFICIYFTKAIMQCRFCDAEYRVRNEWVLIWSARNLLGCRVSEHPVHLAWFSYSKCSFHLAARRAGAPLNLCKTTRRQGRDCYCHLWGAEFRRFAHCHTLSCGSGGDITLLS